MVDEWLLPSKPAEADEGHHWLFETNIIFGPPKCGKSTLMSQIPKAIILNFERKESYAHVGYEHFRIDIDNLIAFNKAVDNLINKQHDFKLVVIDTLNASYRISRANTLKANGWNHESNGGFGKGFSEVRDNFLIPIEKLMACKKFGLFLVCHETVVSTDTSRQHEISLGNQKVEEYLAGQASSIIYFDSKGKLIYREGVAGCNAKCGTRWKIKKPVTPASIKDMVDNFESKEKLEVDPLLEMPW